MVSEHIDDFQISYCLQAIFMDPRLCMAETIDLEKFRHLQLCSAVYVYTSLVAISCEICKVQSE